MHMVHTGPHILAHSFPPFFPAPWAPPMSASHPSIDPRTPCQGRASFVRPQASPATPGEPGEGSKQGRGPEGQQCPWVHGTPCTFPFTPRLPARFSPLCLLEPLGSPRPFLPAGDKLSDGISAPGLMQHGGRMAELGSEWGHPPPCGCCGTFTQPGLQSSQCLPSKP